MERFRLIIISIIASQAVIGNGYTVKSATFLSPAFVLGPGSVENRIYPSIDFPTSHIGIKSFDAEVVDELGNPIPLHETYLHHWILARYRIRKSNNSTWELVRNSGICQENRHRQYYGLGSETRKTSTRVPDPYGIPVGDPADIPDGYEEKWLLNVHAIDTRGVEDRLGCTECLCSLYNVTIDGYVGGLHCCEDHSQCKLKEGFQGDRRSLYLRYTVKWVDWDDAADDGILPVQIFIFDVTDTGRRQLGSESIRLPDANGRLIIRRFEISTVSTETFRSWKAQISCHEPLHPNNSSCWERKTEGVLENLRVHSFNGYISVEYNVASCETHGWCVDIKRIHVTMPTGGYVVYGVGHQHTGGIGSTLYRKDGEAICNSVPMYGTGDEPGNEAGYIVGMTTCYPEPGSLKLTAGEELVLESNYTRSSTRGHTGVMGLFYILVADQVPPRPSLTSLHNPVSLFDDLTANAWTVPTVLGVAVVVVAVGFSIWFKSRRETEDGYRVISA